MAPLALMLWACSAADLAHAMERAWVSWVMDGDTVLVLPEGAQEAVRLRLVGIDAPETCQPGGAQARDALIARVLRRTVQIEPVGRDSYDRRLGRLWLEGQDVGAEMVRTGHAWAYSYRVGRGPYAALQREARRERRGLFGLDADAMPPALFRQFHGSCHEEVPGQAPTQTLRGRAPHTGQAGSR